MSQVPRPVSGTQQTPSKHVRVGEECSVAIELSSVRWGRLGVCSRIACVWPCHLLACCEDSVRPHLKCLSPEHLSQRTSLNFIQCYHHCCPIPSSTGCSGDTWVHPHRVSAAFENCRFPGTWATVPEPSPHPQWFCCPPLLFEGHPPACFYLFWGRKEGKNAGTRVFTFLSVPWICSVSITSWHGRCCLLFPGYQYIGLSSCPRL